MELPDGCGRLAPERAIVAQAMAYLFYACKKYAVST
jgi:hypothetical protein